MYPVWLNKILDFFGINVKAESNTDKNLTGNIAVDLGTGTSVIEQTDLRKKLFELF